jgi:hypothetical protein
MKVEKVKEEIILMRKVNIGMLKMQVQEQIRLLEQQHKNKEVIREKTSW